MHKGGGYSFSALPGHIMFVAECQKRLVAKGREVVVAFLEYGKYCVMCFYVGYWTDMNSQV